MTVGELLARTSSRELSEWRVWYELRAGDQVQDELKRAAIARLPRRRR
jgi:hypothetical protein